LRSHDRRGTRFPPARQLVAREDRQKLVYNQLNLPRGGTPLVIEFSNDTESTILRPEKLLCDQQSLGKGDPIVIISDILARDKLISAVQMRPVE
jgi:hypothetical protein